MALDVCGGTGDFVLQAGTSIAVVAISPGDCVCLFIAIPYGTDGISRNVSSDSGDIAHDDGRQTRSHFRQHQRISLPCVQYWGTCDRTVVDLATVPTLRHPSGNVVTHNASHCAWAIWIATSHSCADLEPVFPVLDPGCFFRRRCRQVFTGITAAVEL